MYFYKRPDAEAPHCTYPCAPSAAKASALLSFSFHIGHAILAMAAIRLVVQQLRSKVYVSRIAPATHVANARV